MKRLTWLILSVALTLFAGAEVAQAQATRTWVSGVGDDANPCSRTAPCKTFAGAISKTATGGEINAIDAGAFGGVTITKSISIIAQGGTAGVLVSGVNGITVNLPAAGDNVMLQGLDIEGLGNSALVPGLSGIKMIGAGDLVVKNCNIRNFTNAAAGFGIDVRSTLGAHVLVQDSTITGNIGGINVVSTGANNTATVTNTVIGKDTSFGIKADGSNAKVFLDDSVVVGAASVLATANGGSISSYGNNVLRNGTPTSTLPLQ